MRLEAIWSYYTWEFAQSIPMELALPHIEDGQVVVFNPDNFAFLVFKEMIKNKVNYEVD